MGITRLASDHLPVIAEFDLQVPAAPEAAKADKDDKAEASADNLNFLI